MLLPIVYSMNCYFSVTLTNFELCTPVDGLVFCRFITIYFVISPTYFNFGGLKEVLKNLSKYYLLITAVLLALTLLVTALCNFISYSLFQKNIL